jgi:hypothetical protein
MIDAEATARIRDLVRAGRRVDAAAETQTLISAEFDVNCLAVEFTVDEYSLNSVSGLATLGDGTVRFFKFHQEDGEADHVAEYYRAQVLADAGLPVDLPLAVSTQPGRQIALYARRTDPRMADVCLSLEEGDPDGATLPESYRAARRSLDRRIGEVAVASLRPASPDSARSGLHQLFSHRMRDADGTYPGARLAAWYTARPDWPELAELTVQAGDVRYGTKLGDLVNVASRLLDPRTLAAGPQVIAHGDDHHGNVWAGTSPAGDIELSLFDAAFAGADIPALLAPVKATFHNALAHPWWLYHPLRVDASDVRIADGVLHLPPIALSPLRREILDSVVEEVWRPMLTAMAARGELPDTWRATIRAALLACPMLVVNLMAGDNAQLALARLGRAMMVGDEPVVGSDEITQALDALERAVAA